MPSQHSHAAVIQSLCLAVCACVQLLGTALKSLPRDDVIVCTKIGKYAPGAETAAISLTFFASRWKGEG